MFDSVALLESCRKVADIDPSLATGETLMGGLVELESSIRALEAARASWLGHLDRRGTTDEVTGHRTAAWFALATNGSRASARRVVRTGRRTVGHLDGVRAALAGGEVSVDHAHVLADLARPPVAAAVAACEGELLALAGVLPFERWRAEVQGLVGALDADGGFRPGPDASTLRMSTGFGGSLEMAGTFVGDGGQVLRDALGRSADRLAVRYRREVRAGARGSVPTRAELIAEALVDLVRCGTAAGSRGRAPVTEVVLVTHAHDPLGAATGAGVDRPSPVRPLDERGSAVTGAGAVLSDATARTLCCDPVLRAVVLDSLGNPLDLGRRTRLVPPGLRRAVQVRDGGCTFPGCDAPSSWCDLHHVVHWADGGDTSAENLASLCRHHHGVTHRSGWRMAADPDRHQRFRWTRPDGTVLRSQRATDHPPAQAPPPQPCRTGDVLRR